MKIDFKGFLSKLDYDCLKVELDYLKDNYNLEYKLTIFDLFFDCDNKDIIELIKDSLKLSYGEYLKRGAICDTIQ